jgi:acylphosphatase
MVIARFYVKNGVQGVGYRPFILEQIFNFDLNGAPKNLLDGRVEVVVEGRREDIEDFYEYLKAKMPPATRNPGLSEAEFGEFHVMDRTDTALALNLNQWNTAIPVVISINKNVVGLGKEMREGFECMCAGMREGFERMDKNFERMNETLETLPERIARAFKDMK